MRTVKDLAESILTDIAEINPYSREQKHLAFVWAVGFLSRCVAEMIWRDSDNLYVYRRIRAQARERKQQAPLLKDQN